MSDMIEADDRYASESGSMTQIASARQIQEVQAAMVIARKFPRDEARAASRIVEACKGPGLAERASYEYSRGGQTITGPSIRLAETMARAWGNLDFGITEIDRRDGESTVMVYCWDLETNVRQTKVFAVRHMRDKKGGAVRLNDDRDIYELIANHGARRMRACILGIIPGDIQDRALEQCDRTLIGKSDKPFADQVSECIEAFKPMGVTPEMIERKLRHALSATTPQELARLRRVWTAIRDKVSSVEHEFPSDEARSPSPRTASDLMAARPAPAFVEAVAEVVEPAAAVDYAAEVQAYEVAITECETLDLLGSLESYWRPRIKDWPADQRSWAWEFFKTRKAQLTGGAT